AVTNARANAVAAGATGDPAKIGQAENMLSQSLRSLFAVSENYPELKAISAFTNLQENLTATEDKLEFSRRFYNGNVRDYNIELVVDAKTAQRPVGGAEHQQTIEQPNLRVQQHPFRNGIPAHLDPARPQEHERPLVVGPVGVQDDAYDGAPSMREDQVGDDLGVGQRVDLGHHSMRG